MKSFKVALLFAGAGLVVFGDSVATFNFNSLGSIQTNNVSTNTTIQNYMTGVLQAAGCVGCTVTVTDGTHGGVVFADQTYTGDGYVVGPYSSGSDHPVTLGNTDGATSNTPTYTATGGADATGTHDTFLSNVNDSATQGAVTDPGQIDLTFHLTAGYTLSGTVSFDFEIFPDGSCSQLNSTHCGGAANGAGVFPGQPGLTFDAGLGSASAVTGFGVNGTWWGATPGAAGLGTEGHDGSSTRSVNDTTELAPQWIGNYSTSLSSFNELNFVDWPAAIGIDNLSLTVHTPVPETSSVLLLGTLSLMLIPLVRRARKA